MSKRPDLRVPMVLLFLAVDAVLLVINGFVIKTLWGWFLVPTFNVPSINIPLAIGIAILVGLLAGSNTKYTPDDKMSDIVDSAVTTGLIKPVFALIVGAIVHYFFL